MKKLSVKSLESIAFMITGDVFGARTEGVAPYRTRRELNDFWYEMSFSVDYDQMDFEDATSRYKETLVILKYLNTVDMLREACFMEIVSAILSPQIFEVEDNQKYSRDKIAEYLNKQLKYDNLKVQSYSNKSGLPDLYRLVTMGSDVLESPEIDKLDHHFIKDQHSKAQQKIKNNDFDGAVANARTLVEGVMQEILKDLGYEESELEKDLDDLYKMLKKELNLEVDSKTEQVFKQILTGLQSLVSGFSSLGNKMSERHATRYRPQKHHAELAVNSAYTICEFLLSSLDYQKDKNNAK